MIKILSAKKELKNKFIKNFQFQKDRKSIHKERELYSKSKINSLKLYFANF